MAQSEGSGSDCVPTDPAKLQSEFSQWMQKVSANLGEREQEKLFILIDSVDHMTVSREGGHAVPPRISLSTVVVTLTASLRAGQ